MKLKRVLCVLMAAMMVFGAAACGGNDAKTSQDNSDKTEAPEQEDTGDKADTEDKADENTDGEETETPEETTGATGTLKVAAV